MKTPTQELTDKNGRTWIKKRATYTFVGIKKNNKDDSSNGVTVEIIKYK